MIGTTSLRMVLLSTILLCMLFLPTCLTHAKDDPVTQLRNLRLKLPEIFNWSRFKESFHKVYPNIRDELARQKLFITNALRTFAHNIVFRWGKSSHYLSINNYADLTRKEVKRLYTFRHGKEANNGRGSASNEETVIDEVVEDVSLEGIQQELARILEEKSVGYESVAKELENKIDAFNSRRRKFSIEKEAKEDIGKNGKFHLGRGDKHFRKHMNKKINLFRSNMNKPEESAKYKQEVPPTNPDYKPLKLTRGQTSTDHDQTRPLPEDYVKMLEMVPGVTQVKESFSSFFKWVTQELDDKFNNEKKERLDVDDDNDEFYDADGDNSSLSEDKVYLDHRDSGCLSVPRDQGDCGSCYAFATVALMEWLHCNQTGELVPFSEQYMVDCGFHTDLDGCDGGYVYGLNKFSMDWGVELQANYPYKEKETNCPYKEDDWHKAGYKKPVFVKSYQLDNRKFWPLVLRSSGPMFITINVPDNFHLYGGGVHEGDNCSQTDDDLHAMVLVGHGVEDGQDYWLMRNSHGFQWGEWGYFKMAKDAPERCFDSAYEFVYDFVKKSPPVVTEIDPKTGKKRNLPPSKVQEKKYADILLGSLTIN